MQVTIRFNARVDDLIVEDGQVKGIVVSDAKLHAARFCEPETAI
jgi:phytoene dehydrogenase-like protein